MSPALGTKRRAAGLIKKQPPAELNLVWDAVKALPGFTYPPLGLKMKMFGAAGTMSREFHVASPVVHNLISKLEDK